MKKTLALSVFLIMTLIPLSPPLEKGGEGGFAFAQERRPAPPPVPVEEGTYSVEGYIEEILRGNVMLYGKYYDIGDVPLKDRRGNAVDRDRLKRAARVEIKFKKYNMTEVILIHDSKAEGR